MTTTALLSQVRARLAEHDKREPECHEHYEFDDLVKLLAIVEVYERELRETAKETGTPYSDGAIAALEAADKLASDE